MQTASRPAHTVATDDSAAGDSVPRSHFSTTTPTNHARQLRRYHEAMSYGLVGLSVWLSATMLVGQSAPAKTDSVSVNIRARVCDAAGLPIAGAGIVFGRQAEWTTTTALKSPDAWSNANGIIDFVAKVPPPPHVQLFAVLMAARGKVAYLCPNLFFEYDGRTEIVPELDLGELRLADGHTLSGRIRGKDGKPIASARIRALDGLARHGWMSPNFASQAVTNSRGVFTLPGVFAHAMTLKVEAAGYYDRKLSNVSIGTPLDLQLQAPLFA